MVVKMGAYFDGREEIIYRNDDMAYPLMDFIFTTINKIKKVL